MKLLRFASANTSSSSVCVCALYMCHWVRVRVCGYFIIAIRQFRSSKNFASRIDAYAIRVNAFQSDFNWFTQEHLCTWAAAAAAVATIRTKWTEDHCNVGCQMGFFSFRRLCQIACTNSTRRLCRAHLFSYAWNFDRIELIVTLDNVL